MKSVRDFGHRRQPVRRLTVCSFAVVLAFTPAAVAGPRWMLVYYRQIGRNVNGGSYTLENHLFRDDGTAGAGVGVTNQFNPNTAIWGNAGPDGWHRVDPDSNAFRDVRIFQQGIPTDQSPNFYHYNPNNPAGRYRFETHWLYVSDDSVVTAYPTTPVFHYDLVDGINSSSYVEPPGMDSDAFSLTEWTQPIYQTFVVPAGINRIVSCKAWGVDTHNYRYVASIHECNGGPVSTWPQVGPAATSRLHSPVDFIPVIAHWPLDAVPVTPGQTYALRVRPEDNLGFNSYATNVSNYPQGHLWLNNTPVPGRDLCAVVVGVGRSAGHSIVRNPPSITRSVAAGDNLPNDTFTVANGGSGTMGFSVSADAAWLSLSPTSGSSSGSPQSISILYDTVPLAAGTYTGTITISAASAGNSPQAIAVYLTVDPSPFARVDHDRDGDVDQEDFGWFQRCFTGQGNPQNDPNCLKARLDGDTDVDQDDFTLFFACMSGANVPADPNCVP